MTTLSLDADVVVRLLAGAVLEPPVAIAPGRGSMFGRRERKNP